MTVELLNMDCMEYMAGLSDNAFDLACCDPEYGIKINNNMGRRKDCKPSSYKKIYWDDQIPCKEYFESIVRVSENQIIWGANHFIDNMFGSLNSSCWLMFDKKFSDKISFAQFELAWTSFKTTCKKFEMCNNNKYRIHPTQKPVALYKWIFQNYAKPGQSVIDTHLGSGSSAIAAHYAGLDFVGCEIDKDYFDAACKRFKEETRQLKLF